MAIPQYRYPCTCLDGWHSTPRCPYKQFARASALNRSASDLEYQTRMIRRQMEREGLIPPQPPRRQFRWWWILLGLVGWLVLMILL